MKKAALQIIPWLITVVALYFAFRDISWDVLASHIGEADRLWLVIAVGLTCCSYLLRARRWQSLFPERVIDFPNSARVLILGFFMNNILPARAGEFVRAHMGAQVTSQKRTLVLATIASERLSDGLMLSIMFVVCAFGLGDSRLSGNLLYVAWLFAAVAVGVAVAVTLRSRLINLAEVISRKLGSKSAEFAASRVKIFLHGLSPLTNLRTLPVVSAWTALIWLVELSVFACVSHAFNANLSPALCVLFMVAVNFSSLIPGAPGGIGIIEAVAKAALVSVGVPPEKALTMAIAQHVIQYLVVGIPGALVMFGWKRTIHQIREIPDAV